MRLFMLPALRARWHVFSTSHHCQCYQQPIPCGQHSLDMLTGNCHGCSSQWEVKMMQELKLCSGAVTLYACRMHHAVALHQPLILMAPFCGSMGVV